MESRMYNYNRYTREGGFEPFSPAGSNWFISAQKANESIYFPNLTSYNNWAGTCCGASRLAINRGSFNGYTVSYNRPF